MNNQILIDTSFLYAVFNPKDGNHAAAAAYLATATKLPLVPSVVLPEVGFLFMRDLGHHAA